MNKIAVQVDYGRPSLGGCRGHNNLLFFYIDHKHSINSAPVVLLVLLKFLFSFAPKVIFPNSNFLVHRTNWPGDVGKPQS